MDDDYERTLCQLPQVHVFKIPVRKSAEGHRASDWPKDPTWTGKLKIIAKGRLAAVMLMDAVNNSVFAVCPVSDDSAVERTLDSGRYFVLRIQNAQGKHAFIGIAFNDRNHAFDFNVTLQEHKDSVEREDKAARGIGVGGSGFESSGPLLQDLSIKAGEKLKINITGGGARKEKRAAAAAAAGFGGGGGLRLAPPPADKAFASHLVSGGAASQSGGVFAAPAPKMSDWDSFGTGSSFSTASSSSADPFAAQPPPSSESVWDFAPSVLVPKATTPASFDGFAADPFAPAPQSTNPLPW